MLVLVRAAIASPFLQAAHLGRIAHAGAGHLPPGHKHGLRTWRHNLAPQRGWGFAAHEADGALPPRRQQAQHQRGALDAMRNWWIARGG